MESIARTQEATRAAHDYTMGAAPGPGGVAFRVWAPQARAAHVLIESGARQGEFPLQPAGDGFFAGQLQGVDVGDHYRYRIDRGTALADPATRFQPNGPEGASQVYELSDFSWTDSSWSGLRRAHQVIYEMHVGTFTPQGSYAAAAKALPLLAQLGVTVIELMPLAEFSGRFGWGYDGVYLFAPYHHYGTPRDLCRFIDTAHGLGVGVILDVVYNHFGPASHLLRAVTPHWFGAQSSEWGDAPNFDGEHAAPVRSFYAANAAYWIGEFHFDGLRLDATQQIFDRSERHILHDIVGAARAAAGTRSVYVLAESQLQDTQFLRSRQLGGYDCDAVWNDDFHHALCVALNGRRDAYYSDYRGTPQEIVSAIKHGFLYQGQHSAWINKPLGTPTAGIAASAFVHYLENHDQVANTAHGERLAALSAPARLRAATALLLLMPQTPLLFQGQEFASQRPFHYFADHPTALAQQVRAGRAKFMQQFESTDPAAMPDPAAAATFENSQLDPHERDSIRGQHAFALHRDLLELRRNDPTLREPQHLDGAVLDEQAFVLRLYGIADDDRLLLVNLGADQRRTTIAEPLLAPPQQRRWSIVWSSEDARYGGNGGYPYDAARGWHIVAQSATLLRAVPSHEACA